VVLSCPLQQQQRRHTILTIAIPPNVAAEGAQQAAKFVAMIQAALCFVWTVSSSSSQPDDPVDYLYCIDQNFESEDLYCKYALTVW